MAEKIPLFVHLSQAARRGAGPNLCGAADPEVGSRPDQDAIHLAGSDPIAAPHGFGGRVLRPSSQKLPRIPARAMTAGDAAFNPTSAARTS